jgi:putative lipoprotein
VRGGRARLAFATATLIIGVAASLPARAADPDPWFGRDKALHFAASSTIAAGGYAVGAAVFDARGHALIFGGALAAVAGIGKEVLDLTGFGDPSWRDLTWDGIGTVTGLALAWGVDLLLRGVSPKHPVLVSPVFGQQGRMGLRLVF